MIQTSLKVIFIFTTAFAVVVAASRLGYVPFVAAMSAFGALLISYFISFSSSVPWYAYPVAGSLGGLLGLIAGMYSSWYAPTPPVKYISNFEYQRAYVWHRAYQIALFGYPVRRSPPRFDAAA